MSLTSSDKNIIFLTWDDLLKIIAIIIKDIDSLIVHPTSKKMSEVDAANYSTEMKAEGEKIMKVIENAVNNMDDLTGNLQTDDELTYKLWTEPTNFKMMAQTMKETFIKHFPDDFTPNVLDVWDKFLREVSENLIFKPT